MDEQIHDNLPLENGGIMRLVSRPFTKSWSIYYFDALGRRHNTQGPSINHNNRTKMWFINGERHRVEGPAFITPIGEIWYYNGMIHRFGGPALTNLEFNRKEYFLYDTQYSRVKYNKIMFIIISFFNKLKKILRYKYNQILEYSSIFYAKNNISLYTI